MTSSRSFRLLEQCLEVEKFEDDPVFLAVQRAAEAARKGAFIAGLLSRKK